MRYFVNFRHFEFQHAHICHFTISLRLCTCDLTKPNLTVYHDISDTLEEFKLIFYGTETSLELDDDLDKDKPLSSVNHQDVSVDNSAIGARHNVVVTDPWTGSQQVECVSHQEVQRPTTENQTSGCSSIDPGSGRCLGGCLILLVLAYLYAGVNWENLATSWQDSLSVRNESDLEVADNTSGSFSTTTTLSRVRMATFGESLAIDKSSGFPWCS